MLSVPALIWRMVSNDATRVEARVLAALAFPADCAWASPPSPNSSRPTPAMVVFSRLRRRGFIWSGMAVSPLSVIRSLFDWARSHGGDPVKSSAMAFTARIAAFRLR